MEVVTVGLFAPVLVLFVVVLVGERFTAAAVAVVSFVWELLSE